jgi:hypothetical protein
MNKNASNRKFAKAQSDIVNGAEGSFDSLPEDIIRAKSDTPKHKPQPPNLG